MTAPIVYHVSREHRLPGVEQKLMDTFLTYSADWQRWIASTSGQLWERVEEGKRRD